MSLDPEYIRSVLSYDRDSGEFRWLDRPSSHFSKSWVGERWNKRTAGTIAGSFDAEGYRQIKIDGQVYRAHRVAWVLENGEWPAGEIDHINGNKSDNAISNLRIVTTSENARNRKLPISNKSGVVGVCWVASRNKWMASITVNSRFINLGYFGDLAQAAARRAQAQEELGYHKNHGRAA